MTFNKVTSFPHTHFQTAAVLIILIFRTDLFSVWPLRLQSRVLSEAHFLLNKQVPHAKSFSLEVICRTKGTSEGCSMKSRSGRESWSSQKSDRKCQGMPETMENPQKFWKISQNYIHQVEAVLNPSLVLLHLLYHQISRTTDMTSQWRLHPVVCHHTLLRIVLEITLHYGIG